MAISANGTKLENLVNPQVLADIISAELPNAIALAPKQGRSISRLALLAEGSITEITAGDLEGISTIYTYAFYNIKSLTSVTFPSSIISIGEFAFFGCHLLGSIRFGGDSKIEIIGANAFNWCAKLSEVYLPETPPTLADVNAFANINKNCTFYCKTQASLDAYKAADNWSTLTDTYSFVVEP